MDPKIIGERLKKLRGERSAVKVAKAIGICQSALSMYENGQRIPTDTVKIKLAEYYGTTVEKIFFADDERGTTASR